MTPAARPGRAPRFDVAQVRARLPDPAGAGARQAARLPRQRRHHAEAAGGARRARRTTTGTTTPTSTAATHLLSERATGAYEGARAKVARVPQRRRRARDRLHAGHAPRASTWWRRRCGRADARARRRGAHHVRWSTTRTSCPGSCSASRRARRCGRARSTTRGELDLDEFERLLDAADEDRRGRPRVERARHGQPGRGDRSRWRTPPAPSVLVDGAQAVAAHAGRRAGARLRLLRVLRPQDVRPDRHRRALRQGARCSRRCRRTRAAAT